MSTQTTEDKVAQVQTLRQQIARWRIATTVATVGVTGVCVAILCATARALYHPGPAHDEFVVQFRAGLTQEVAPQVKTIAQQTWKEMLPAIRAEVVHLERRAPEMTEGVRREVKTLRQNLQARSESVLRGTVTDALAQREATIRELYADVTPEKLSEIRGLFLAEAERRVGNLTEVVVTPYEQTLQKIVADLETIRATETVNEQGQPTSREVAALLLDLANQQFAVNAATLPAAAQTTTHVTEAK